MAKAQHFHIFHIFHIFHKASQHQTFTQFDFSRLKLSHFHQASQSCVCVCLVCTKCLGDWAARPWHLRPPWYFQAPLFWGSSHALDSLDALNMFRPLALRWNSDGFLIFLQATHMNSYFAADAVSIAACQLSRANQQVSGQPMTKLKHIKPHLWPDCCAWVLLTSAW
jgi:hypothetical protein